MKSKLKSIAAELAIPIVGFCTPSFTDTQKKIYRDWVSAGNAAGMQSLQKDLSTRLMETELLPGQRSVIMCGFPYPTRSEKALISDYALLNDYHGVVRERLVELAAKIEKEFPDVQTRAFVDSAPVWEKALAFKAGLGAIGKNTLLIHPVFGTRFFLGGLLTTLEIEPDAPCQAKHPCRDCNACIKACPTAALTEKGLDSGKCLSYHTIENRHPIPGPIQEKIREKAFGCSRCEIVCPQNRQADAAIGGTGWERPGAPRDASADALEALCHEGFKKTFCGTPVYRTGKKTLLRNLAILKSNQKTK